MIPVVPIYDPDRGKIVGRYVFSPDTINTLTVQEARKRLSATAITSIADVLYKLKQQPHPVKADDHDFEIEFVTFDEHAKFKEFATFKIGQLELIDRALK
jgi:hypothetical protein